MLGALALEYRWSPIEIMRTMTPTEIAAYYAAVIEYRGLHAIAGATAIPAPHRQMMTTAGPTAQRIEQMPDGAEGLRALFGRGR